MHNRDFMFFLHIIETWLIIFICMCVVIYVLLAVRHQRGWHFLRTCAFISGMGSIVLLYNSAMSHLIHDDFRWHMVGHLVLGMLSPLLIALSHPMTLLLSQLPTHHARQITKLMRSRYATIITHPVVAMILNIGGLYVIYLTPLFTWMHENIFLYVLIHIHVFLAGYVFTISIIRADIQSHYYTLMFRAIVLIVALGLHKALCKFIYQSPPMNVPVDEARQGAMIMYYGGDVIDVLLIVLLCYEWYTRTSRRTVQTQV